MSLEGPIVIIFYAFITCFLIAQVFDFVLRKRRKKAMNAHLKKLEENMAVLHLKMQDSALDLQESIAMINKEYGSSIEEMNLHKARLEKEIDHTMKTQDKTSPNQEEMQGVSDRKSASIPQKNDGPNSKKTSQSKGKSNKKNQTSDTKVSRKQTNKDTDSV